MLSFERAECGAVSQGMSSQRRFDRERRTVLSAVLEEWTHRVGPEAAVHRIRGYRFIFYGWIFALGGFTLLLGGGLSDNPWLLIVGGVGIVGWLVMYIRAGLELHRMNKAIARSVGIEEFGFFAGPSSRPARYRAWCEKHRISPYPFSNVEPPLVRTTWF